jgi:hypothetical protein
VDKLPKWLEGRPICSWPFLYTTSEDFLTYRSWPGSPVIMYAATSVNIPLSSPLTMKSDDEMFLLRRTKVRDLVFVVDVGNKVQYLNKPLRGISPRPFVVPVCFGGNIRS